ncbi:hypothetical protein [Streptomyces sp. NPDC048357]|uniref:hypothetical protein n=1 Tax=Streptomyces sp. NPDC048357 TaxID=3154719 RepID=UPI0034456D9B
MNDPEWVPQSCTLPTEATPLRVAEWDTLFAERLTSLSRPEALRLRLTLVGGPGVEDRVSDLVERESACCSFFVFTITPGESAILLDIAVDHDHADVLESLAVRAGAAGGTP